MIIPIGDNLYDRDCWIVAKSVGCIHRFLFDQCIETNQRQERRHFIFFSSLCVVFAPSFFSFVSLLWLLFLLLVIVVFVGAFVFIVVVIVVVYRSNSWTCLFTRSHLCCHWHTECVDDVVNGQTLLCFCYSHYIEVILQYKFCDQC